jgi:hypothetical protein
VQRLNLEEEGARAQFGCGSSSNQALELVVDFAWRRRAGRG